MICLPCRRESEFIQNIVQAVSCRLNDTPEAIISNPNDTSDDISGEIDEPLLVGIGSRAKKFIFHLDLNTDDVRTIGAWGMAGIGKTTIARVVYQKLFDQFDVCCFLGNVRERSEQCSLVDLQKHLLCQLLKTNLMLVIDVHHGIGLLSKMFRYNILVKETAIFSIPSIFSAHNAPHV